MYFFFLWQGAVSPLHKATVASLVQNDGAFSTRVLKITNSKDLKNKENLVTENILLHSSFETLPLEVLRTNYFQYVLASGDLIKGAFLFQLADETWSAEDLSDLDGSSGTPPDTANFSDPRNQNLCHRPEGIQELGRQGSFISL